MTSHQSAPWPAQGQHSDSHPNQTGSAHHPPPHAPQYHPHHSHPSHHGPSPHAHPQHPYYPYPSYAPYPPPYPHPHGHPYPPAHGYPPQPSHNINPNGAAPSFEHVSASSTSNAPKSTEKTKTAAKASKTSKAAKDSTSAESTKSSTASKTPKTFRFEGSISSESFKTTKSFDLAGVNILNRKPLDTKTALDKLQRRRETHNRVERKRRDCINQLIDDLTKLLPPKHLEEATSKCHRVNVLRGAVSHIKFLNESNEALVSSIRSIKGEDAVLPVPAQETNVKVGREDKTGSEREMSMDIDDEIKEEDDMDQESQLGDDISRSNSPASTSTKHSSSPRKVFPPPVIVTDAPNPSTEHDAPQKSSAFSLESRPRSNSFASSIGEQSSPGSTFASPLFPPSPMSPLPRQSLFPPGEDSQDGSSGQDKDQRRQLSPFMSPSSITSPSLPPISSLANMQLQSPSGHLSATVSEDHSAPSAGPGSGPSSIGRSHRAGTSLPPLMIPEPHHLHPSYQQGGALSSRSDNSSKRSSLTLSPNPADQPLISPFMLSPMLPRSPSIGPTTASSPGNSPYPYWGQDGMASPHGFPFANQHYPYGYQHPNYHHYQQQPQPQQQAPTSPPKTNTRPKSLQPESIFIQEEPWNVQRKRSTSNTSGRTASSSKTSAQEKKKPESVAEVSGPMSPTSSVTSTMSYPASPNPKKRTQLASYDEGASESEDMAKRSRQAERERSEAPHQRDSGVIVVVEGPENDEREKRSQSDEDAIQALTSLAQSAFA
ncbi:hypothetical protein BGX27_004319 [Mortierella sp. AM989]|nr:hypothetical protein BGX27_004319 [Mortierella sp. AM989]